MWGGAHVAWNALSVARSLRSLDICAGPGGLALGLRLAGFRHVDLLEKDAAACRTLSANLDALGVSDPIEPKDIKTVDFATYEGQVDLLSAGVPCQPFSQAGNHLGHVDERNLFPVVIEAVRSIAPSAVLIENVYALVRPRFRDYLEYIERQLRTPQLLRRPGERWRAHLARLRDQQRRRGATGSLGYRVSSAIVRAADFGLPQLRSRLFIVAFRDDLGLEWRSPYDDPDCQDGRHTEDGLLYAQWVDGSYWKQHGMPQPKEIPARIRKRVRALAQSEPAHARGWLTVRDALSGLREPTTSGRQGDHARQPGARCYDGHTGSRWDWPAKTIKAGVHGVAGGENMLRHPNGRVRYFTVREAATLQGFPETYSFAECGWGSGLRQVGNAVPVTIARLVGGQLARSLRTKLAREPRRRTA